MGQSLSEPKTDKETHSLENENFVVGCSCMQGWRPQMEDAHTVHLDVSGDRSSAYFGVFDGHGSSLFAEYCSENLHRCVTTSKHFEEGNYPTALRDSFLALDQNLQTDPKLGFQFEPGGTTAVVVLVREGKLYCANVGDSRAIVSRQGGVVELSHDHKPMHPSEENRIYKAGGWVEFSRVNGNLALSRAIGDFNFKSNHRLKPEEQIITADPEIITSEIHTKDEFAVLACDGVWDVMSNVEVIDFVRQRIAQEMNLGEICEALLDRCLAPDCRMGGLGCDNMTVIIVGLLQGGSYGDLATRCSEKAVIRRDLSPAKEAKHTAASSYNGLRDVLYGDISEDPQDVDGVPHVAGVSKLNDTLRSANTDLDREIRRQSTSSSKDGDESGESGSSSPDGVDEVDLDESLSRDSKLDILHHPIETTV